MIGRTEKVRPFDLIRWARAQSRVHGLAPREAHVLLLLATYADDTATAWPSIRTLALDCGLSPTSDGRNSSVSAAISRLEELRLLWTKQGGHGHPARRELLFDPATWRRQQPHGDTEGSTPDRGPEPSDPQDGYESDRANSLTACRAATGAARTASLPATRNQPSASQDQKYQRGAKEQPELPNSKGQRKPSADAEGFPSASQEGNDPASVRAAIAASLASTTPDTAKAAA